MNKTIEQLLKETKDGKHISKIAEREFNSEKMDAIGKEVGNKIIKLMQESFVTAPENEILMRVFVLDKHLSQTLKAVKEIAGMIVKGKMREVKEKTTMEENEHLN